MLVCWFGHGLDHSVDSTRVTLVRVVRLFGGGWGWLHRPLRSCTSRRTRIVNTTQRPEVDGRRTQSRGQGYEDLSFNSETGHDQNICTC